MIEIIPITGIGEVTVGADLARLMKASANAAGLRFRLGDVLVVTQKIVSKAEGRIVALSSVVPSAEAQRLAEIVRKDARLVELVMRESTAILRAVPNILITRHRLGLVMANAGIDRSNIGPGSDERALLLPLDPDASAERIARSLAEDGDGPSIIISDSFGRAWRMGVVPVAIGSSGLPALLDRRGEPDRDGRKLEVTQIGLGDMLASAAGLIAGEGAEGIPAVLIRGYPLDGAPVAASRLNRLLSEDLFQ